MPMYNTTLQTARCLRFDRPNRLAARPTRLASQKISAVAQRTAASESNASQSDKGPLADLKVFVAGATGGCGREVVKLLRAQSASVRALARNKKRAEPLFTAQGLGELTIVEGDVYQYSTLPKAVGESSVIICCTGAANIQDPFGPFNVDYQGTLNLLAVAKRNKVKKFILVSSIGADDPFNPLNLFYGVLFWKKRAEEEVQRSGIEYTIVRPGGLKNSLRSGEFAGNIVMKGPGYFGVPPHRRSGSILRRQVAEVCVAASTEPAAANKVVEIIADDKAFAEPFSQLFASVE